MLPASIRPAQPATVTPPPAMPPQPAERVREVIVKSGETLSHYGVWAGLSIKQILKANPKLEPEQIYAGKRLRLPLTDEAYAEFVMARAGVPRHERELSLIHI